MKASVPVLPELVLLSTVPGGELVSCAQYKEEILFVPYLDADSLADTDVVVFNIDNGESRQLSPETTVIWHNNSTVKIASKQLATKDTAHHQDKQPGLRWGLDEENIATMRNCFDMNNSNVQIIKVYRELYHCTLTTARQNIHEMRGSWEDGSL